jgi:hypothetical protein
MPEPPERKGDEPLPAGTALAPLATVTRLASSHVSEIRGHAYLKERQMSRFRHTNCDLFRRPGIAI